MTYKDVLNLVRCKYERHDTSSRQITKEESAVERYLRDLATPSGFSFAWEHSILPFLVEVLPNWFEKGYAINILCNSVKSSANIICFTSQKTTSRTMRVIIAQHVLDVIPDEFHKSTSFRFCCGTVERLGLGSKRKGVDKKHRDEVCDAKNPYFYLEPMMGDSIGPSPGEATGTIGPRVQIRDLYYWLACLHVFKEAWEGQAWKDMDCRARHPGDQDINACKHANLKHSARFLSIGHLAARSGDNLETTRQSCHPYWQVFQRQPHEVVTDWVLISTTISRPNTLRVSQKSDYKQCPYITTISPVFPGVRIHTTGRTSAHQYGQVCRIPAYLDPEIDHGAVKATREWFIEQPEDSELSEDGWLEGGPGLPGDSGAPVIDSKDNALYGQIWGRNKYWGEGPRIAYFSTMQDICLDVQERTGSDVTLELPQCDPEDTGVLSHLMCQYCNNSPCTPAVSDLQDENSDRPSIMSFENDGDNVIILSSQKDGSSSAILEGTHEDDWIQPESDVEIPDSEYAIFAEETYPPEEGDNNARVEFNESTIIDMIVDHWQHYDDAYDPLAFGDDSLSIDDEEEDADAILPMRSCSAKKGQTVSTSDLEEKLLSSSWVMVLRPKLAV